MCEKKRRHLQKNEKHVQLGYYGFTRFYRLSAGTKNEKTYAELELINLSSIHNKNKNIYYSS